MSPEQMKLLLEYIDHMVFVRSQATTLSQVLEFHKRALDFQEKLINSTLIQK